MKANSRRRVLISSLSMLLVALVALSTATYAWFTSNTQATGQGINVKTVKSSKLVISNIAKTWDTQIDYDVDDKALLPVSSANGTNWFKAEGTSETDGSAKTGTYSGVTVLDSYVIKDQLNVKNEGETAINNVTITVAGLEDYVRVALVETSNRGAGLANTGTFSTSIIDSEGDEYIPLSAASAPATDADPITCNTCLNDEGKFEVGNLAPNAAKYYNLYVWFEGQDADCYDNNQQIVDNIVFTVNGTPAA